MSDPKPEPERKDRMEEREPLQEADSQASREFALFFTGTEPDPVSWIGLGLEGGLATAVCGKNGEIIVGELGAPVPLMVERLHDWQSKGLTVKVFTPLAATEEGIAQVKDWLAKNELPELPVTNAKDLHMLELWDARCVQVIANAGIPVGQSKLVMNEQAKDSGDGN